MQGEYVLKELEALVKLHKYRTLNKTYNQQVVDERLQSFFQKHKGGDFHDPVSHSSWEGPPAKESYSLFCTNKQISLLLSIFILLECGIFVVVIIMIHVAIEHKRKIRWPRWWFADRRVETPTQLSCNKMQADQTCNVSNTHTIKVLSIITNIRLFFC